MFSSFKRLPFESTKPSIGPSEIRSRVSMKLNDAPNWKSPIFGGDKTAGFTSGFLPAPYNLFFLEKSQYLLVHKEHLLQSAAHKYQIALRLQS